MKQDKTETKKPARAGRLALKIVWKTVKYSLYVTILYFAYKGITA